MKRITIGIIIIYQAFVSPIFKQLFGESCRFSPTCSQYMKQSVKKYGMIKGVRLGLRQLVRCHPWGKINV